MKKFNIQSKLEAYTGFITEPELKYLDTGSVVVKFAIPLKNKKEDEPIWLNCEAWGALAENIINFEKGSKVFVQGILKKEVYQGKEYIKLQVYNIAKI